MRAEHANGAIVDVDATTFSALVLQGQGPIAVEFMSYSCAHCGAIEPVLQQAAQRLQSSEKVFRVNVALEPELASDYGIQGTPTLVMFWNGQEVGRVEGPGPSAADVLGALTLPFEQ